VSSMGEAPLARSSDLIVEELGDEVLVYDTNNDRAHSLSAEAAKVWRHCNGSTSTEDLSSQVGLGLETVNAALVELSACELLEVKPTISTAGSTRREATIKFAKLGAAVASAPLIISVAAPPAAFAVTFNQCNAFNTSSNDCGAGGPSAGCKSIGCCCCTPANCGGCNKFCSDTFANCAKAGATKANSCN
jgi:hypothetical protein